MGGGGGETFEPQDVGEVGFRKWAPNSKSQLYVFLPYADAWQKILKKFLLPLCMFKLISASWGSF